MKPPHLLLSFLALNVTAVLVHLGGDQSEANQKLKHYESTYQADMSAMAYVARVNDLRAKLPQQPLRTTLATLQPCLPAGFTVSHVDEQERHDPSSPLRNSEFVVERTGPSLSPYLTILDNGMPLTHYVRESHHAPTAPPASPAK